MKYGGLREIYLYVWMWHPQPIGHNKYVCIKAICPLTRDRNRKFPSVNIGVAQHVKNNSYYVISYEFTLSGLLFPTKIFLN